MGGIAVKIGLISLFVKLGVKILPVFLKLLKSAKSLKAVLALASFGLWELFFSWQFAVLLMLTIFIHESGHVWAMRRMGMKTKGFYFVPLLGGAAVPDDMFPSRGSESYVAIMGPIWGGLMIIPVFAIWYATENPLWAGIIGWIAMINLFNLLPILPLDGGRILRSIAFSFSRKIGFVLVGAGIVLGAYISFKAGLLLFVFLFFMGGLEILIEIWGAKKVRKFNSKLAFLQEVFPGVKRDEMILACNEDENKDQMEKLFEALSWDNMDKICASLTKICPSEEDSFFRYSWERNHYHSAMDAKQMVTHQYHIAAHIMDWLYKGYAVDMRKLLRLFQNPMSGGMAMYSAAAYCAVAGLLYYAMHLTRHIPGSQAALAIFQ